MKTFRILAMLLALVSTSAFAQTLNVSWVAPVERTDLTPININDIATFRIAYGTSPGVYSSSVDVNNAIATSTSIEFLPGGEYFVTISVIDTDGRTSVLAAEQSIILDTAPPKSVTGLTLTAGALPTQQ